MRFYDLVGGDQNRIFKMSRKVLTSEGEAARGGLRTDTLRECVRT